MTPCGVEPALEQVGIPSRPSPLERAADDRTRRHPHGTWRRGKQNLPDFSGIDVAPPHRRVAGVGERPRQVASTFSRASGDVHGEARERDAAGGQATRSVEALHRQVPPADVGAGQPDVGERAGSGLGGHREVQRQRSPQGVEERRPRLERFAAHVTTRVQLQPIVAVKREPHGRGDAPFGCLHQQVLDAGEFWRVNRAAAEERQRRPARLPLERARRAGCHRTGEVARRVSGRHHVHTQALGVGRKIGIVILVADVHASQPQRRKRRQPSSRRRRRGTRTHPLVGETDPAPSFADQPDACRFERDVQTVERSLEGPERERHLDPLRLYQGRPARTSELEAFDCDVTGNQVVADARVVDGDAERRAKPGQTDLDQRALDRRQVDGDDDAEDQGDERYQPPPDPPPQS